MGKQLDFEIFFWLDEQLRKDRYPQKKTLMDKYEISERSADRAIQFMRDRLREKGDGACECANVAGVLFIRYHKWTIARKV
jgi:hypothetical protein